MKELIAKFEELLSTNEYKFYADGVQDCIKVVKDYLTSHKTRQAIQVTEGEFEKTTLGYIAKKGNLILDILHSQHQKWVVVSTYEEDNILKYYFRGDLLKDGVIAANAALKKLYEDVSEEV